MNTITVNGVTRITRAGGAKKKKEREREKRTFITVDTFIFIRT